MSKYGSYQAEDFLTDDYFVETMLFPAAESEKFWATLCRMKKINESEFNVARTLIRDLNGCKPDVPDERICRIWERIIEIAQKHESVKRRRLRIARYAAAACFIGVISGISLLTVFKTDRNFHDGMFSETRYEHVMNPVPSTDQIQLIAGDAVMEVDGAEADIEYAKSGKMKINRETVDLKSENVPQQYQLCVPYGKKASIKLPDGTLLWVNSGSTVIYPSVFSDDQREIFVEGEIYAEVSHDTNRPFIVKTSRLEVKVLGTVFNLSAYKEEEQTCVVLVSGAVSVQPEIGGTTLLQPNQMYTYEDRVGSVKNVSVDSYVSWRSGIYILKNESINSILRRLSRYYNVTIKLSSYPSDITYSGKLVLKNDLEQLLKGLSEVTSMTFVVKDNEYLIDFKK